MKNFTTKNHFFVRYIIKILLYCTLYFVVTFKKLNQFIIKLWYKTIVNLFEMFYNYSVDTLPNTIHLLIRKCTVKDTVEVSPPTIFFVCFSCTICKWGNLEIL